VQTEVVADRPGFVTVFNVGPTGVLNLLQPLEILSASAAAVAAQQPLLIGDVELTPSTGRERLCAVWSRAPLPVGPQELQRLAERGQVVGSRPYRATRDMKRVQQSMQQLGPDEWHAVSLELDQQQQPAMFPRAMTDYGQGGDHVSAGDRATEATSCPAL
jgi:hypothetical protein